MIHIYSLADANNYYLIRGLSEFFKWLKWEPEHIIIILISVGVIAAIASANKKKDAAPPETSPTPRPSCSTATSRIKGVFKGCCVITILVCLWVYAIEPEMTKPKQPDIKIPGGGLVPNQLQIKIKGEIQTTRFPLLCNDDVWLQNDATVPITNVRVLAVVLQNGRQITTNTLTLPTLNAGAGHTWPGVLKIPNGKIEAGSYLKVQCDQLIGERIIWCQNQFLNTFNDFLKKQNAP